MNGESRSGCGLRLPAKALAAEDRRELRPEDLHGYLALVLQVFGQIHGGHAARAELALDVIVGFQ